MSLTADTITKRKLVLAKELFQQSSKQAELKHSVTNRIMAVIGFDLAVETLLKVVYGTLESRKTPSDSFPNLFDQCDNLLSSAELPSLTPYRALVLHTHSVRNDAQHKAKYPNEVDVQDARTHTKDFCQAVIQNVWGLSFEQLSIIELLDDETLRSLLSQSLLQIQASDNKKALTFAEASFYWASQCFYDVLPKHNTSLSGLLPLDDFGNRLLSIVAAVINERHPDMPVRDFDMYRYQSQLPRQLRKVKVEEPLLDYLQHIERKSAYFAAILHSGISLVDYRRFQQIVSPTSFHSGPDQQKRIIVHWGEKEPTEADTLWAHHFVVNSIVHWQTIGLNPIVDLSDSYTKEHVRMLLEWDNVMIS